jgi:serine/threonine protein kinase
MAHLRASRAEWNLGRSGTTLARTGEMATCPKCLTRYEDEIEQCKSDGTTLVPDAVVATMDRDLVPGEMIGEYKVDNKLGAGGFGSVYHAVHPLIGKRVAIKVLSRRLSSDPEMVSRFVSEARSANQIRNKHIVDIFGFGALPDGRQYYVMEVLHGATLEQHVRARGYLEPLEAVTILRAIARGLDAAQAAGIVHRDLKPENVILVEDEDVGYLPKLLDFGIAKLMAGSTGAHKTRTGVPMGTPYYMSPEQCRGDKSDHGTDVYSLGIVAFQLLTGRLPFDAESFMQLMFQHVSAPPPLASATRPGLSPELDGPLLSMLEKTPQKRPESAGAAIEELAEAARRAGIAIPASGVRMPMPSLRTQPAQGAITTDPSSSNAGTLNASSAETLQSVEPRRKVFVAAAAIAGLLTLGALGLMITMKKDRKPNKGTTAAASVTESVGLAVPVASSSSPIVVPAPPTRVKLKVSATPPNVEVFQGERKLGLATDADLELERGSAPVSLTFKLKGFKEKSLEVDPKKDVDVSVELKPHRGGARPGRGELEF